MIERQRKHSKTILAVSAVLILCACRQESPKEVPKENAGAICANEDTKSSAIALIFEKAVGTIKGSFTGKHRDELLAVVQKMSDEPVFNIDSVTFDHYDERTAIVGCEAFLSYHFPASDFSPRMKKVAVQVNENGLTVPHGLLDGMAQPTPFHFEVRDVLGSPGGKMVESGEDLIEPTSAVIRIATDRAVVSERPKA